MSRQFNTDGLMVFPQDNGEPITLNAFESIECAIAFDVRDWSEDRRSAWIYAIVCGWEDAWEEVAQKFGWDEEDHKRANMMHEQWTKAKEVKEQPEIVQCKNCKHRPTKSNNYESGFDLEFPDGECECQCSDGWYSWYPPDDWFCANGERR